MATIADREPLCAGSLGYESYRREVVSEECTTYFRPQTPRKRGADQTRLRQRDETEQDQMGRDGLFGDGGVEDLFTSVIRWCCQANSCGLTACGHWSLVLTSSENSFANA